jgi:DNA-binding transcriptional regulator LsrR (DeoR family)
MADMRRMADTRRQRAPEATAPDGWPEQLAVRAAWCYHMLGLTQAEVAERLGLTRMRVNRLLAEARERGLVTVSIDSPLAENVELEEELRSRFGLSDARVVLAGPPQGGREDPSLARLLGQVAAAGLAPRMRPGITLGVGWGVTLKALAAALRPAPARDAAVVALLGSLNRRSAVDAFEAATLIAQKLSAECYYLPGPLICDRAESRDVVAAQPAMAEAMARARAADMAVLSIGGLDTGTVRQVGLVEACEVEELREAGAVGNFLGHYIDARAQVVDHPVNARVVGLEPEALRRLPERVMVSGGPPKLAALGAVLEARLVTELVTDQDSARRLLRARG